VRRRHACLGRAKRLRVPPPCRDANGDAVADVIPPPVPAVRRGFLDLTCPACVTVAVREGEGAVCHACGGGCVKRGIGTRVRVGTADAPEAEAAHAAREPSPSTSVLE
jgi:hypothetical protein